jgi:cellulose biosynthesis protein BcsQ
MLNVKIWTFIYGGRNTMTKIIITPRGFGKTTTLINWARQSMKHGIIVKDLREKDRLVKFHGLHKDQVITIDEAFSKNSRDIYKDMEFGIDNLDLIINQLFNRVNISVVTWGGE